MSYLHILTSLVLRNLNAKSVLEGSAPPSLGLFFFPLCVLTRMQGLDVQCMYIPGTVLGAAMQ